MKIRRATLDEAEALRHKAAQDNIRNRNQTSVSDNKGSAEGSVQISSLARELGALEVPRDNEVRADKVAELKAKIERGEYKVDSEAIARKFILDIA